MNTITETDNKKQTWLIALDDQSGIESHALVNQRYALELEARGHRVISLDEAKNTTPDLVIHHNYTTDFLSNTFIEGVPHVAIRTSDFGPHPTQWVERINSCYEQLWVHTEWTKKLALEGGIDAHRVRVMPHGVDSDVLKPDGPLYELPTEKGFRFLFVGGAAVRKGVDVLIKAYAEAFGPDDDVSLVIKDASANVFYKDNLYRNQIIEMAEDPTQAEVIHIDGHLSTEDLAALFRTCTIGVWPYRGEGFLMPALECKACGTPTMLPEIGPTRDFSNDETSFLVPTVDVKLPLVKSFRMRLGFKIDVASIHICEVKPSVLAKSMRMVYESEQEILKAKSAACLDMANGQFKWAHIMDYMEKTIDELLDDSQVVK